MRRWFPIAGWLPAYQRGWLRSDVLGGLTVTAILIPEGMAYAQLNLGLLYASGRGVPQDNVEALTWLQLALFALPAGGTRSDVARAMQDVSEKMTSEQREDAREHARVWKAKPETRQEAKPDTKPAAK